MAMPIYEFFCPDNNKLYSFLARSAGYAGRIPRCPEDPSFRMQRVMSGFAVTGRAREPSAEAGGEADDPRLEAAMAEMEREMAGMDEENPDPRQLARMMRRMTGMVGEKMPEQVEEMIGRMEAGEDLESLEERFGEMDEALDELGEGGDSDSLEAARRTLRNLRRQPRRDPALYDIRDYLD